MKVVIIGGGIIGLCSAYYLQKTGAEVIVVEKTDGNNNCSYGNAGYISPSHFIPLASPGLVKQALKWMFNSSSPFYMKPRLDWDFMKWGLRFLQNANTSTLQKNSIYLNELLQYSREKTLELSEALQHRFFLKTDGCYMMCRQEKTLAHEIELAEKAKDFGLETKVYSQLELRNLEPEAGVESIGAVFFPADAHVHPVYWMEEMKSYLQQQGVTLLYHEAISGFQTSGKKITTATTEKGTIKADEFIIATGSWLPESLKTLGIHLLLQAGKGYSMTFDNVAVNLNRPAILVDDRVALTPLNNSLRIGGTMELSGINHHIHINRANAIVSAVNKNFTNLKVSLPPKEKIWCGLRPVTPDGLPYIGRTSNYDNLIVAGGHAMLGVSLAAGTGKIVSDLIQQVKPEIHLDGFSVER